MMFPDGPCGSPAGYKPSQDAKVRQGHSETIITRERRRLCAAHEIAHMPLSAEMSDYYFLTNYCIIPDSGLPSLEIRFLEMPYHGIAAAS